MYRDKLRGFLFFQNDFGVDKMEGDNYLNRMNNFAGALEEDKIWKYYDRYRRREIPQVGKLRTVGEFPLKDLLHQDNFTQNQAINETFRKGYVNSKDIRKISHPNIKYIHSMCRGVECKILSGFLDLDDEFLNRRTIKPVLPNLNQ